MKNEAALSKKFIEGSKPFQFREGLYLRKIHGNSFNASLPDVMGCFQGLSVGFEMKIDPNKPTKAQAKTLVELRKAGALVAVVAYVKKLDRVCVRIITADKTVDDICKPFVDWGNSPLLVCKFANMRNGRGCGSLCLNEVVDYLNKEIEYRRNMGI